MTGRHPGWLCGLLFAVALALSLHQSHQQLTWSAAWQALQGNAQLSLAQQIFSQMWLPRQGMAWLCGLALGFTGVVMQQALRNPLAEPMTLGIASGATLALSLAALVGPSWLLAGREWVAFSGALLAFAVVFLLSLRQGFTPLALTLAGMLVNLYCGSVNLLLSVIYDRSLAAVFIWGGGTLAQENASQLAWLLPRVVIAALPVCFILRPLRLLTLNEQVSRSIGLPAGIVRGVALLSALVISSLVISVVGVIGFIGLAAPHLAVLAGAKTLRQKLIWSPLLAAGLLWLTDQGVSRLNGIGGLLLPTGMMTALAGGPLLLWFLPRLRHIFQPDVSEPHQPPYPGARYTLLPVALLFFLMLAVSLDFARGIHGWHWSSLNELRAMLPFRLPRLLAAISAGMLLAAAGVIIQRISRNPMASPELLGIGAGAALGITVQLLLWPLGGVVAMLASSAVGALLTLALTLWQARHYALNPQRMLLSGLAITALFQSVAAVVLSNNGMAAAMLRQLMTGSTYYVNASTAGIALVLALLLLALTPLLRRALLLLPLSSVSPSLGLDVTQARLLLMVLAAAMTGVATLIVGPLSFIGLLGPQLARQLGARRPLQQLTLAVLIAAVLMMLADWAGNNLLYPRQIPAGLMATLIGGPWLALLLWRPLNSTNS
ncbi:Fe(3+)-hydroxamate ABC transporter permease FhuB [Pantoea phytobeneficialis]|uniref:Fe(3+)-hydroxamate ABC transporter permease FhuB n=1 Tax=Pantoea phytobeneficialis TaxID=2052056 RepID=A0AAP9H9C1_9GAMM|nr:Fe(3+)-hydroxamate ABC transporter permease FhuB [Pantoea phytobeneficialis]MDO6409007.1 Fe(3+)-hydroxamate ABC transporter permease FhuB [Pantoea phytobeneficialis]QGR08837.1 Fe(3+)-hydroxamate ABC transporter permease FhuB [Pantoea phytobeneficialis]